MKKRVFLIWSILSLTLVIQLTSCGDNKEMTEDDYPFYADIGEKERIVSELEDVQAYVYDRHRQYVFICYSKYADEYYESPNPDGLSREIFEDVQSHRIGVKVSDFEKYNILTNKVYISASVTNNCSILTIPSDFDPGYAMTLEAKAYLKNLSSRN